MAIKKLCLILSIVLLSTTTIILPHNATALDLWKQLGIFGEESATVVFGTPGLSASPDVCFDETSNYPRLVWADTLRYGTIGTFNTVFSWFNGYSFRGSKYGSRTIEYLDNTSFKICSTPRIESIGNGQMLAVWATIWGSNSNIYWSYYPDATSPFDSGWSIPKIVNDTNDNVYEYTPDIVKGSSGNVWLTYVKNDIDGKKTIIVSRFNGSDWEKLPGDPLTTIQWGTIIDNSFDSIVPKIVETPDGNPAVFYEGVVSSSNSDIFCTKWSSTLGQWRYYNNLYEGSQNISNSTKPSHTPSVTMDSLGRPLLVWSEAYSSGQDSGISYCRWNGNWVNMSNQPGFSMVTTQSSNGTTSKPSITTDSNDQPQIAFDMFDRDSSRERACLAFYSAGSFINPFTGLKGFGWVKDDFYNEFTDCQIERNPKDANSPILIGVCKTPKNPLLAQRNSRDTNIFYVVIKKNPANSDKNPLSILCKPFNGDNGGYSKWFSSKPTENRFEYLVTINEGLQANEYLYLFFNIAYNFNGNPWGNINRHTSEFLTQTRWNDFQCQWWNQFIPGADKWDSSYPWSVTTPGRVRAIRIRRIPSSEKISVVMDFNLSIISYYDYPTFYMCEAFTSQTNYHPSSSPHNKWNPYDPPFSTSDTNRLYALTGYTPIESKDYFTIDPQYYEVDQGSYTSGSFLVINPISGMGGNGQPVYGKFKYKLTEITGSSNQGVYVGFYPNNQEVINEPYASGLVYISASLNANPVIYNLEVLCELTLNGSYPVYYMAELTVRVRSYDLSVKKTADKSRADLGETVTYTITVRNSGDGAATNVQVFDNLPRELEFISASDNGALDGAKVTWIIKKIFGGQAYSLKLFVRIRDDINLKNGDLIINSAYLKSGKGSKENSVGIMIQTYLPGCPKPQVEFRIDGAGKNPTFEAGQQLNAILSVTEGCGPFDASVNWGDGSKSQRFVVGTSGQANTSFTYNVAGDYTIFIQVNDIYGKCTNVYKNIRIK